MAEAAPPPSGRTVSGSKLVLPIVLLLVLALLVIGIYKAQEKTGPAMHFERVRGQEANATELPFRPVHDAYFLEDHLVTAIGKGNSTEVIALRVETMQQTLLQLTKHDGPWLVAWNGVAVRITLG